jgi:hypothetical protein
MTNTSLKPSPALILLIISAVNTALVPAIAAAYGYNSLFLALSAAAFILQVVLTGLLWMYTVRDAAQPHPAGQYIAAGLAIGVLWVIEIGINNFIAPPLPARDIIDNIFWAAVAVLILVCAAVFAHRAGRLWAGVLAGAWSGLASGAVACCMALLMIVFAMSFIERDSLNVAEWAVRGPASGAPTITAYFAYETFLGAFLHLSVLGVVMGALLGLIGGMIGKTASALSRSRRNGTASSR